MLDFAKNLRQKLLLREIDSVVQGMLGLVGLKLNLGRLGQEILPSVLLRDFDLEEVVSGWVLDFQLIFLVGNTFYNLPEFRYGQAKLDVGLAHLPLLFLQIQSCFVRVVSDIEQVRPFIEKVFFYHALSHDILGL